MHHSQIASHPHYVLLHTCDQLLQCRKLVHNDILYGIQSGYAALHVLQLSNHESPSLFTRISNATSCLDSLVP